MGYIGNAPYQGVLTGGNIQDGTVETTDLADGAVTTVKLGDNQVTVGKLASTLDLSGKTVTLPAGVGGHASGTQANRPASPAVGTIYFNTDEDTLQQYTSTGWKSVGAVPPAISSIAGGIYSAVASNLTITGSGFGASAVVRFSYGGTSTDVSLTPDSDTQIIVAVPGAVYGQTTGTTVTISVLASGQLSNGTNKTVIDAPTGGTITTSGGYRIHTFLSSGNLIVPSGFSATAEYLLIAGGGSGGGAGGGGAGGLIEGSTSITTNTYPINIGPGAPAISTSTRGNNGTNSTAFGLTAVGGGGGGDYNQDSGNNGWNGRDGGSGGGAGWGSASALPGNGTSGQGFAGGNGQDTTSNPWTSGGGGGAGGAGGDWGASASGNGGPGKLSSINGTALYWAGGGGGGAQSSVAGNGGIGGGGGGATYNIGSSGTGGGSALNSGGNGTHSGTSSSVGGSGGANTGGGGGGMGISVFTSGAGGSGICIIRYQL